MPLKRSKPTLAQCKATTSSGGRRKAKPHKNGLCFFHSDPKRAAELGRKGGRRNRHTYDAPLKPVAVPRYCGPAGHLERGYYPCHLSVQSQLWRNVKPQRQAVGAARLSHTRTGSASFIPTPREQQSLAEKEEDAIGTPTMRRCNLWLSQNRPGM